MSLEQTDSETNLDENSIHSMDTLLRTSLFPANIKRFATIGINATVSKIDRFTTIGNSLHSIQTRSIITTPIVTNKDFDNCPDQDGATPGSSLDNRYTSTSQLDKNPVIVSHNQSAGLTDLNSTLGLEHALNQINNDENTQTNITDLSFQQRLDVRVFPPALTTWCNIRTLQGKKLSLELRTAFNKRLMDTEHYPLWSVNFHPTLSLLQTERAIEATVGFRMEQSKQTMEMVNDLMAEEINRLQQEIRVALSTLRVHYENPNASGYSLREATDGLTTLLKRQLDLEQADLNRKYNAIHVAPSEALWTGFRPNTVLLPNATRPSTPRPAQNTQYFPTPG